MGYFKYATTLDAGETKFFEVVDNEYAIFISGNAKLGAANFLLFAAGYGVTSARNNVYHLAGSKDISDGYNDRKKGFSLTNNSSIATYEINLFFMKGSTVNITTEL